MGIPNFNKYLKSIEKGLPPYQRGINKIHLSNYSGKCIAIDVCIFIYQSLYSHQDGHIQGMLNLVAKLKKYDIIPLFVFDGKPPQSKHNVISSRKKNREKIKSKIIKLENSLKDLESSCDNTSIDSLSEDSLFIDSIDSIESRDSLDLSASISSIDSNDMSIIDETNVIQEIQKLSKKCIEIKTSHIEDLKKFFDMINISYIHLKEYEADIVCSQLVKNKIASAVISNDMDLLAYNCNFVLRGLDFKSEFVSEYNIPVIRNNMDLTDTQLTDLCIMMGCDYSKRLFSHANCHDYHILLRDYGCIENIINAYNNNDININHMNNSFKFDEARDIFTKVIDIDMDMINNNLTIKDIVNISNNIYNIKDISNSHTNYINYTNYNINNTNNINNNLNNFSIKKTKFTKNNKKCILDYLNKKCPSLRKKLISIKLDTILYGNYLNSSSFTKRIECY